MTEHVIKVLTRNRIIVGLDDRKVKILKGKVLLNDILLFEVDSDKDHLLIIEAQNKLLEYSSKLTIALKNKGSIVKILREEY